MILQFSKCLLVNLKKILTVLVSCLVAFFSWYTFLMDITYGRRGFFGMKFKITVYYGGRSESTRNLKQWAPSTRTENNECVLFLSPLSLEIQFCIIPCCHPEWIDLLISVNKIKAVSQRPNFQIIQFDS